MELDFLTPLLAHPGPFATVYLDTTRAHEDAQDIIELRWRALRRELAEAGADGATLAAIDQEAGADRGVPGEHGQAIFAAGGQVLLREELPSPPDRDTARWAPLPQPLPMLTARGERIPHVVVVADRLGADITVVGHGETWDKDVEGDATYPIHKTAQGGWSQARYERAVEKSWDENAGQVAEEVVRAADAVAARVVILAGDVRARTLIQENLRESLRDRVVEVPGSRAPGADEERLAAEVQRTLATKADERIAEVVDEYRREYGQRDRAVDGLEPVVAALRRGQVARLLVRAGADLAAPVWFGPDPLALAVTEPELAALGVAAPQQDRADAVLIRALARAEGDLTFVPGIVELRDDVAAVLRFADASTQR